MATVSDFLTGPALASGYNIGGQSHHAENVLDFSVTNVSGSDVVQALNIPANALVKSVWVECMTVEGGVATMDIGDGADADGWDAAVDANSAAGIIEGDGAFAGGKLYSSADTIDIVPSADLDTAKIRIVAEFLVLELS